ncbi:MAG: YraN family protein [Coriobacteriia bacterium]|nr:YraN family protein [Coriobacteriia bacterium]
MSYSSKETGITGEALANKYLCDEGITVIERNWRCNAGEADIIAIEDGTLVFIEVKTRTNIKAGFPEESVTRAKRHKYEIIAAYYLSEVDSPSIQIRFDVISVLLVGERQAMLRHHRDVFSYGE